VTRRLPLVAGNWKMNKTVPESLDLAQAIRTGLSVPAQDVEVALLPPFTSLWPVSQTLKGSDIGVGAQNIYWEDRGAFTGEISPLMVSGWCRYALIGHSERRHIFGESDEMVGRKVKAALRHGLRPLVAVGETLEEHDLGRTADVLGRQVPAALAGIDTAEGARLVVAYEPVWAIGTGKTATPEQAQSSCAMIRELAGKALGAEVAAGLRILYGGSVTPASAAELLAQPDVDGALVGGASLVAVDFLTIVAAAAPSAPTH
jgi:triosephosphate isomerase